MMIITKQRLLVEQRKTGFRAEILEKVAWLVHILNNLANNSELKAKYVLKGGTALNLFYFNLPRLSVDIDLNYIGCIERSDMLVERKKLEGVLVRLLQQLGLIVQRHPTVHAGGKMVWCYQSALGHYGNIDIDLNYMYRLPLLPVQTKSSITLLDRQAANISLLDIHELAAGKLTALLDRKAGRDLFDANKLFEYDELNVDRLRVCFVVYLAMSRHNYSLLHFTPEQVEASQEDFNNKLLPMLNNGLSMDSLLNNVRRGFEKLLPLTEREKKFVQKIYESECISPELITQDTQLQQIISRHPALLWALQRS